MDSSTAQSIRPLALPPAVFHWACGLVLLASPMTGCGEGAAKPAVHAAAGDAAGTDMGGHGDAADGSALVDTATADMAVGDTHMGDMSMGDGDFELPPLPDAATMDAGAADAADDAADDATPAQPGVKLGFAATMSGKFGVFDVEQMTLQATLGQGHVHVHGCAVLPGQQVAYIPNADDGTLDRYEQVAGDPKNWQITKTYAAGIKMGMLDSTPDGKAIVMSAGDMVIQKPNGQLPKFSKEIVVFRTDVNQVVMKTQTSSPNSVAIDDAGQFAYAGNWLDHNIAQIDIATGQVAQQWDLPTNGNLFNWVGPSRITLSHNGKWLLSCDLTDQAAVLINVADPIQMFTVPTDGLAHWCEFSNDDKTFYVTTWKGFPNYGDEAANTKIPAVTLAFDTATQQPKGSYQWQYLVAHAAAAPGTPWLFLSGSYGSVLRLDAASLQLTGQVIVEPGMPMPAMTISF